MPLVKINWHSWNSGLTPMARCQKISSLQGPWEGCIQAYSDADHQGRWKQSDWRSHIGLQAPPARNSFLQLGRRLYTWHSCMVCKFTGWVELDGNFIWTNVDHLVSLFYVILMNWLNWLQYRSKQAPGTCQSKQPQDPTTAQNQTTTPAKESGPSSHPNKPAGKEGHFNKPQTARHGASGASRKN